MKQKLSVQQRRKTVAAQVVSTGRPLARIAASLAVTRETVSHDFNHPETQNYVQTMLAKRDQKIDAMVDKYISAVESSLGAMKDDKEDHQDRMRAGQETARLLQLRAGRKESEENRGFLTGGRHGELEELLLLYRRVGSVEE